MNEIILEIIIQQTKVEIPVMRIVIGVDSLIVLTMENAIPNINICIKYIP